MKLGKYARHNALKTNMERHYQRSDLLYWGELLVWMLINCNIYE